MFILPLNDTTFKHILNHVPFETYNPYLLETVFIIYVTTPIYDVQSCLLGYTAV
jgi:hypothetical protein